MRLSWMSTSVALAAVSMISMTSLTGARAEEQADEPSEEPAEPAAAPAAEPSAVATAEPTAEPTAAVATAAAPPEASELPMTWVMRTEVKGSEIVSETKGPNRRLLVTGLVVAGVGYGLAAGVALTSPLEADNRMIVPLLGPWLALSGRGDCGSTVTGRPCTLEGAYKFLIITDGLMQLGGAITILTAFLYPETRYETKTIQVSTRVRVMPTTLGPGGYGLAASGWF